MRTVASTSRTPVRARRQSPAAPQVRVRGTGGPGGECNREWGRTCRPCAPYRSMSLLCIHYYLKSSPTPCRCRRPFPSSRHRDPVRRPLPCPSFRCVCMGVPGPRRSEGPGRGGVSSGPGPRGPTRRPCGTSTATRPRTLFVHRPVHPPCSGRRCGVSAHVSGRGVCRVVGTWGGCEWDFLCDSVPVSTLVGRWGCGSSGPRVVSPDASRLPRSVDPKGRRWEGWSGEASAGVSRVRGPTLLVVGRPGGQNSSSPPRRLPVVPPRPGT